MSRALVDEFGDSDALCGVIGQENGGQDSKGPSAAAPQAPIPVGKAKAKCKAKFALMRGADESDWRSYLLASEDTENAVDVKRAKNRQRRVVKEQQQKGKKGFRCLMHVYSNARFVLEHALPILISRDMITRLSMCFPI